MCWTASAARVGAAAGLDERDRILHPDLAPYLADVDADQHQDRPGIRGAKSGTQAALGRMRLGSDNAGSLPGISGRRLSRGHVPSGTRTVTRRELRVEPYELLTDRPDTPQIVRGRARSSGGEGRERDSQFVSGGIWQFRPDFGWSRNRCDEARQ